MIRLEQFAPTLTLPRGTGRGDRRTRGAFTLMEVLVALALIALVLPTVMHAIDVAGAAASAAHQRDQASGLAQSKLFELIATGQWQNGTLSGDFGDAGPGYRWEGNLQPQQDSNLDILSTASNASTSSSASGGGTLQELNLRVTWQFRGHDDSLTLSTLVYQRASQ